MLPVRNSNVSFGILSIVIHWLSFVLVGGLFGVGLYMVDLTYYDPLYHELPEWHKAFGLMLGALTLVRLLWVVMSPVPAPLSDQGWQRVLAKGAHFGLYLLLVAVVVTGYLICTAEGKTLMAFELPLLPAMVELSPQQAELAGLLHRWLAWALVLLAGGHGLAALKHHIVDRDRTLVRMLSVKQP